MKRVSLLIDTWAGSSSEFVAGIGNYIRLNRNWIVQRREAQAENWDRILAFRPDGIIAEVQNPQMVTLLEEMAVPTINLHGRFRTGRFPLVTFDQRKAGRLLVDHLFAKGHRNLALIADLNFAPNQGLFEEAKRLAHQRGLPLSILNLADLHAVRYAERNARLREWIRRLDLPVGIITCRAEDAERIAQRCHQLELDIPQKVSIVTLDNDQIAASLAYPEFTTVDIPWATIGFESAKRLDQLMESKRPSRAEAKAIAVDPLGITQRRSSEAIAVSDAKLAHAVAFIRENNGRSLSVDEVARTAGISRRSLEKRFAELLGHSPFEEIRQQQLARVKQLLLNSEESIEQILPSTAFATTSHLSNAFHKAFGLAPGQFRRRFKQGSS